MSPAQDDLTEVAVYRRRVGASLVRVWENVLDWEHLPWLHSTSFASIELVGSGPWGWRARIGIRAGGEEVASLIELMPEQERQRYVTRTLEGVGSGSEIWTTLDPIASDETAIEVRFLLPNVPADQVATFGEYYTSLYARLWDEDEEMMRRRERMLSRSRSRSTATSLDLGELDEVRTRQPFTIENDGTPYRVAEIDGALTAFVAVCPHALGPLDGGEVRGTKVRCPWHGYEFDLRTGRSCDGRNLRLAEAPRVEIVSQRVVLRFAQAPES